MKICVIGGGNLGHYIVAKLGQKNEMMVLTRNPELWKSEIVSIDENGKESIARDVTATSDINEAIKDSELIFITWPTNVLANNISKIEPHINKSQWVCFCPGYGGKEFICKKLKEKGVHLFGTQRVFSSTKIIEKGHIVECIDNRPNIVLSTVNKYDLDEAKNTLESLFEKKCIAYEEYLNVTLTPSNPVLHTSRLYSLFRDYSENKLYDSHMGFYCNWNDYASDILLKYDSEVQNICKILKLSGVKSLKDHYEIGKIENCSNNIERMTAKIRQLKFLKDQAPMKKSGNGYVPDFDSRYFKEDFVYGLDVLRDIANIVGSDCSTMNEIWSWYERITLTESKHIVKNAGIKTIQELIDYYKD